MSRASDHAFARILESLDEVKRERDDLEHERDVLLAQVNSLESEIESLRADLHAATTLRARYGKGDGR